MLQKKDGRYEVYSNPITKSQTNAADKWKDMLAKKFNYDPNEKFNLSVEDHPYGSEIFGLKTIVRDGNGTPLNKKNGVIVSTIRMGFGHYRIAMAGVSAAKAMGFQCGFCSPGMIMSAKALLDEKPHPSDAEIRKGISGNLCRCTGYVQIVEAVREASQTMRQE